MEPFTIHRGVIACIERANIDTDLIIPKQFLKSISRTGFGPALFYDWRYLSDGTLDPGFFLNREPFSRASVLVAGNNFGCGSSREHAVWAIAQFGFRAIIAPVKEKSGTKTPAFADIFRNNGFKNGLLTIELSEHQVDQIFDIVAKQPGVDAQIDLPKQTLILHASKEVTFFFDIDPSLKARLLKGLDEIGITLEHENLIRAFESTHQTYIA